MPNVWCSCPHCGLRVLCILGGTMVKNRDGRLILRCPFCERRAT